MENSTKRRRPISKKFSLTDIFSYFRPKSGRKEAKSSDQSSNQISDSVKRFYTISAATFQKRLKSPVGYSISSKSDLQYTEDDEIANMNESWYSCSNFFENADSYCSADQNFAQLERLERHREALFSAELYKNRKFELRRCQTEDACTTAPNLAPVEEESTAPFFSIRGSTSDLERMDRMPVYPKCFRGVRVHNTDFEAVVEQEPTPNRQQHFCTNCPTFPTCAVTGQDKSVSEQQTDKRGMLANFVIKKPIVPVHPYNKHQDLTNCSSPNLSTHADKKPPVAPKPNCNSCGKISQHSPKSNNQAPKFGDVKKTSICNGNSTHSVADYDNWKNFNCSNFEQDDDFPAAYKPKYATVRSMADLMVEKKSPKNYPIYGTLDDRQKINFRRMKSNDGNMQQPIERYSPPKNDAGVWRSKFVSIINENANLTIKQKSDYILHMQDLEKVTALIVKLTIQLRQIDEKENADNFLADRKKRLSIQLDEARKLNDDLNDHWSIYFAKMHELSGHNVAVESNRLLKMIQYSIVENYGR